MSICSTIRGGFVEHLSPTYVTLQSVTKIICLIFTNLVTPKVGAKHELLFNEPAAESDLSSATKGDQSNTNDCIELGHT